MICSVALLFSACNIDDVEVTQPTDKSGKITLNIAASGASFETRAKGEAVADTSAEAKLEWLDVFIFTKGADNAASKLFYYERINHSTSAEPHALGLDTKDIVKGQQYYVHVIANSTTLKSIAVAEMKNSIADRADLFEQIETTQYVHMTGTAVDNNVPTSFLMDGVAYIGTSEPSTPSAVVLLESSADVSTDVKLNVTLRRAAAKILFNFNIKSGSDAYFSSFGKKDGDNYVAMGSYYFDNLKYKACLMAEAETAKSWTLADKYMRNTSEIPYGDLLSAVQAQPTDPITTMQLVAYVYCHKWDYNVGTSPSVSEIEPSVIINLPVVNTSGESYDRNFYELSLDVEPTVEGNIDHFALERNHYYVINATINALGGNNPQTSVTLENIKYEAYPWDEKVINVGGDSSAKYLTLNTYHFEMHNESVDDYTLKFASSSPIESVTLKEAYYYNKYGNRINLSAGDTTDKGVRNQISASAEANVVAGDITVTSPLQYNGKDAHKNTIRYLTFEVKNKQGVTRTFTVMQYPLVYITNQQGWYSYRSDFIASGQSVPTTYQNYSSTHNIVSIKYYNGTYDRNGYGGRSGRWGGTDYDGNFWVSKVAELNSSGGMSNIMSYYYNNSKRTNTIQSSGNARMYHVRITATSDEYVLGTPRITNGKTDKSADNASLVSPSFMIASRLGTVVVQNIDFTYNSEGTNLNNEMYEVFGNHCENYVEVYTRTKSDGTTEVIHLDDWRLPTKAELEIITKIQGTGSDNESIDYLLNAKYYYSASGPVYNDKNDQGNYGGALSNDGEYATSTSVRCVRDSYDSKTPPVITNNSTAQTE